MAQVKGQPKEKEPPTSVTTVYLHVVEDVIQGVRDDFQSEGVDESVLVELRHLWELKMMQAGAIQGSSTQETAAPTPAKTGSSCTPVHDLNVPYEPADEYTPTMDLLFPPTPQITTPITMTPLPMTPLPMTPLPMTPQIDVMTPQMDAPSPPVTSTGEPIMYQYMLPGPSESMDGSGGVSLSLDSKSGRPAAFMQQPSAWMNRKPRGVDVNIDMNATYEEGQEEEEAAYGQAPITKDFFTLATGKRKREDLAAGPYMTGSYIPQRDGAEDAPSRYQGPQQDYEEWVKERLGGGGSHEAICIQGTSDADTQTAYFLDSASPNSSQIPQFDGMDDDYDDGVAEEDYNEPGEEEVQPAADGLTGPMKVEPSVAGDSDGGEPPLNEDDDDDLDDNDQGDEEPQTDHLVLAQFDKVTRSKNKWKCTLKDGIMHLNNKDVLFVKATGEFEF